MVFCKMQIAKFNRQDCDIRVTLRFVAGQNATNDARAG